MTAALLFDLDGTIVDSDAEHLRAFQRVFASHGVSLAKDEYLANILGSSNRAIGERFLPHMSVADRAGVMAAKEQAYRDALDVLEPIPGLLDLLDYADERGYRRALVTNAPRANVDKVLEALALSARLVTQVVAEEVERPKPDPLPYLTALRRLDADARRSVAFEDSISGMRAALGAGLAVIALTTNLKAPTLLAAGASIAVADFHDPRIRPFIAARARS